MTSTEPPFTKFISTSHEHEQVLPSTCSSVSLSSSSLYDHNHNHTSNNKKSNNQVFFEHLSSDIGKINLIEKENERYHGSDELLTVDSVLLVSDKHQNAPVKYGELIVLGYNGCISPNLLNESKINVINSAANTNNSANMNRRKSKYVLNCRDKPNGVKPATQHIVQSSQEADNLLQKNPNHSVTYTLSRNQTVVVQYVSDEKTDMFQIGRSSESAIDFIVLDTVVPPTPVVHVVTSGGGCTVSSMKSTNMSNNSSTTPTPTQASPQQQSTISRFSCRIVVDRQYPYTARIYAAGFDSSKRIFLGEKASKWRNDKGELDGVTTNGVLIMHPTQGFTGTESKSSEWMEVSVCGAVFKLNETRLTPCVAKEQMLSKTTNILRDGTLIDLCGATLVWRTPESLKQTPTKHYLDMNLEYLNRIRPQCPVGLKTLVFPSSASPNLLGGGVELMQSKLSVASAVNKRLGDRVPMVYLKCGHVHGHHDWGVKKDNERECPLCRKVGPYVQLLIGLEPSLYCDTSVDDTTNKSIVFFKPYAFRPCGHMASEKACKYWSRMMVPQGATQGLTAVCPFCSIPLCKDQPFVRLIFQEGFLMN